MIYSKAVITRVAVAAILILGTLMIISSTSQAFAYISYHKGHYHKGNLGYYTTYKHTRHVIIVTR
jgi:lipopolysaccharide export LptBFGC system permease protein LptF